MQGRHVEALEEDLGGALAMKYALDAIEEKYPCFEDYLQDELEIGGRELADIRARYLV